MKQLLFFLMLSSLLLSCQGRQEKHVVRESQATAEVVIAPELYREIILENPSINTAGYKLLTGAGFPEKDAKLYSYAGSLVTYTEEGNADLRTEKLSFADAHLSSDTLNIYIKPTSSLSELQNGWGIAVTVAGKKFSSKYYEWSDINLDGTSVDAENDKLTLNTDKFEKGDTIAGKLFYSSKDRSKRASGYFRAIIN